MTAPITPSGGGGELGPCRFCGKPPGTKVGPPALARCITNGCRGKEFAADTISDWNILNPAGSHATLKARIEELETALRNIACFDDAGASHVLLSHGTYYAFDEPWSVRLARDALASKGGVK